MGVFVAVAIALIQTILVLLSRDASKWTFYLMDQSPVFLNIPVLDAIFSTRVANQAEPNWGAVMNMSSSVPVAVCVSSAWSRGDTSTPSGCLLRMHTTQKIVSTMDAFNPHLILLSIAWGNSIFAISESLVKHHNLLKKFKYGKTMVAGFIALLIVVTDVLCRYVMNDAADESLQYPTILVQLLVVLPCIYFAYKLDTLSNPDHHSMRAAVAWKIAMHQQFISVPLVVTMFAAMGMQMWSTLLAQLLLLCVLVNILWALMMKLCGHQIGKLLCIVIPLGSAIGILRSSLGGALAGWREISAAISIFALLPFVLLSCGHHRMHDVRVLFGIEFWCVTATIMACVVDLALLSS